MRRSIGAILLIIWLLLTGVLQITNFQIEHANFVMGVLVIAAAVFLAVDK